ncbi:ATP-binding protein [Bradyrhizobium guangxiense]
MGSGPSLIRGGSADDERVWFYLPGEDVLEATIGSPKMPGFVSGLWISTLLFLVASLTLLGVWAGRALSSPLSAFARAAEDFSLSRSSAPLPENGPEEIRSAARALNRMRDRITTLMNDRTRMLAAISHDLRTPITRLRLRSEYIEDPTQRTQTVRDLDQMQSMLESVLSLLRSESPAEPTLVDVAALLQMVCEQFSDSGFAVTYSGPDRAAFILRPNEIIRAVTNLVENATRFGTHIDVALLTVEDQLVIDVSDDGPGIPDDRKAAMLEPFVRGEEARTMDETAGFGLGLSIAQAIVTAHDGTLELLDNAPKGLRVRLRLARAARDNSGAPPT